MHPSLRCVIFHVFLPLIVDSVFVCVFPSHKPLQDVT